MTVARELLTGSGSIFVQIGDDNVQLVRCLLDEVFGFHNRCAQITVSKTAGQTSDLIPEVVDYILWYARDREQVKCQAPLAVKGIEQDAAGVYRWLRSPDLAERRLSDDEAFRIRPDEGQIFRLDNMTSQSVGRAKGEGAASWFAVQLHGRNIFPSDQSRWKTNEIGMQRLIAASRVRPSGKSLAYIRFLDDFPAMAIGNLWTDTGTGSFTDPKIYVVQTGTKIVQRCIHMVTDPGDLVLDPTCGSGTTATVAEQWGRRWIVIDTSRVALALARTRLMSAKYPYYLLADSREGRAKEQSVSGKVAPDTPTHNYIRQGFVCERVPHVTLKSIANNAEIDVLWEEAQAVLEPLRARLNAALGKGWDEWELPREAAPSWSAEARQDHAAWWAARIERQRRIDASIARKADTEHLFDRPYEDKSRVRVAGPFTFESLSPHRVVPADEDDLLDLPHAPGKRRLAATVPADFTAMVLEHLRTAGVHQSRKADSIHFTSLQPWPGAYIGADGRFLEGETERRAGILFGPEFGTLSRTDLVTAAREASEARFDVLIACAFNFDAHASELTKLGPMPILKARMNPDLHMAEDLKNTGKGNLFVVFGEPDLVVEPAPDEPDRVRIRIIGVDVFDPQTGDIRSGDTKSIAAWFIDTDYNEESFFVRHAYFLGAQDPYKSLKAALRAEIDEEAWAALYRDVSRPFVRPATGRIAVKVINHFGDEVMKVFSV
jgi:adenine-specific DNA-methyltransferase